MSQPYLPIGFPCLWYPGADTKQTPEIGSCQSLGHNPGGPVTILIQRAGANTSKRNVYHKDSPELSVRPYLREQSGCWDYVECMPIPVAPAKLAASTVEPLSNLPSVKPDDIGQTVRKKIMDLHLNSKDAATIAKNVGIKLHLVEAVIREESAKLQTA